MEGQWFKGYQLKITQQNSSSRKRKTCLSLTQLFQLLKIGSILTICGPGFCGTLSHVDIFLEEQQSATERIFPSFPLWPVKNNSDFSLLSMNNLFFLFYYIFGITNNSYDFKNTLKK